MALINCPECGKSVSTKASVCPHCGNPMSAQTQNKECPECKTQFDADMKVCPNCGCPTSENYGTTDVHYNVSSFSFQETKNWPMPLLCVLSIMVYLVVSVILCNLLGNPDSTKAKLEDNVIFCGIICWLVSCFVAKSNIDRIIYLIVIFLESWLCYEFGEDLGYGTVFVTYGIQIILLVVASYKRNHPTNVGNVGNKIGAYLLASPLIALLLTGEVAGSINFSDWLVKGLSTDEWLSQLLIALVCQSLNLLFLKWLFKKQIENIVNRKKSFRIAIVLLTSIAIISMAIGLLQN